MEQVTDTWSGAGRSQPLVGVEWGGGGTHTSIGLISEGHTAALCRLNRPSAQMCQNGCNGFNGSKLGVTVVTVDSEAFTSLLWVSAMVWSRQTPQGAVLVAHTVQKQHLLASMIRCDTEVKVLQSPNLHSNYNTTPLGGHKQRGW